MFPTELDDCPTLSSNISFHSDLRIHYVDMTAPHKQEWEHRLRHSHTTHYTEMWVTQLLRFKNHLSSMLTHGPLYFIHTTHCYSSDSYTDRNSVPVIPLNKNYQPGPNKPYGTKIHHCEESHCSDFLSHSDWSQQVIVTLM